MPPSTRGPPWRWAGQSGGELDWEDTQTSLHNKPCLLPHPQKCPVPPLSPAAVTKASPGSSHLSCVLFLDQGHNSCMQTSLRLRHIAALLLPVCGYRLKGLGNRVLLRAPCTEEVFQGATPFYLEILKICPKQVDLMVKLDLMLKLDLTWRLILLWVGGWSGTSQHTLQFKLLCECVHLSHCLQTFWIWVGQLLLWLEYLNKHLEHTMMISFVIIHPCIPYWLVSPCIKSDYSSHFCKILKKHL